MIAVRVPARSRSAYPHGRGEGGGTAAAQCQMLFPDPEQEATRGLLLFAPLWIKKNNRPGATLEASPGRSKDSPSLSRAILAGLTIPVKRIYKCESTEHKLH